MSKLTAFLNANPSPVTRPHDGTAVAVAVSAETDKSNKVAKKTADPVQKEKPKEEVKPSPADKVIVAKDTASKSVIDAASKSTKSTEPAAKKREAKPAVVDGDATNSANKTKTAVAATKEVRKSLSRIGRQIKTRLKICAPPSSSPPFPSPTLLLTRHP